MPSTFGARHAGFGPLYDRFRTGLTYKEVRKMLWRSDPDYRTGNWKYKRRGTVLGMWHQMKKEMWNEAVRRCDESGIDISEALKYQLGMALKSVKTSSSGSKSKKGRWVTRAEAKTSSKKVRRAEGRKAVLVD